MARFYGTMQGGRGTASHLGHKTTGLWVTAQSWQGEVRVRLYTVGDTDCALVRLSDILLWDGPMSGAVNRKRNIADYTPEELAIMSVIVEEYHKIQEAKLAAD